MNRLFIFAVCLLTATSVQSQPFCSNLANAEALSKKIARNAPIYSDIETGWVFTNDQLKDRYDMKPSSQTLIGEIVEEFDRRGVLLAIAVPPPRPIVAGQEALDAAMGEVRYNLTEAEASFVKLLGGLNEAGAIVPDLLNTAIENSSETEAFYFRRDTHWTATGAALSALALAEATNRSHPSLFQSDDLKKPTDLIPSGSIEERGSLAAIIRTVCDVEIAPETAIAYDLSQGSAKDLLAETAQDSSIALVGSSFSNRYKRDHYRFGEALSWAFDRDVANYSISGGGAIGAIEAYVLSGALDRREHDLVVWEIPYTQSFNSTSFLRQLLGAIRHAGQVKGMETMQYPASNKSVIEVGGIKEPVGIQIVSTDPKHQEFRVIVHFDNASKTKISLRRRNAVPIDMRADSMFASLEHFGDRKVHKIVVEGKKDSSFDAVTLFAEQ